MKITTVEGKSYPCPTYLVRVGNGWQVRLPEQSSVWFRDGKYGGAKKAYKKALKFLQEKGPITGLDFPFASSERKTKKRPTGTPGVFLCEKYPKGKNITEFQLQIRVPGVPIRTLYVGTTNTWEDRYPAKLEEAKALREDFLAKAAGAREGHNHGQSI